VRQALTTSHDGKPRRELRCYADGMRVGSAFVAAAMLAAACGSFESSSSDTPADAGADGQAPDGDASPVGADAAGADAGAVDAGPCDPARVFGAPTVVADLNDVTASTIGLRLSDDALTAFFGRQFSDGGADLFTATRFVTSAAFGAAVPLTTLNTVLSAEGKPTVTSDLNTLYFHRSRVAASSVYDIFSATRDANGYANPTRVDSVDDASGSTQDPFVSSDGRELFFTTRRGTSTKPEIWSAANPDGGAAFDAPAIVATASTAAFNDSPVLSHDGLRLYFGAGDGADTAIWMTTRATRDAPFQTAVQVQGMDLDRVGQRDEPSFISADECTLYLYSNRSGSFLVYRADRAR
jgi:hypothetical protein